jgi:hypothetical protein
MKHRMPAKEIAGPDLVWWWPTLRSQPGHGSPHCFTFKRLFNQLRIAGKEPSCYFKHFSFCFGQVGNAGSYFAKQSGNRWWIEKNVENRFVQRCPEIKKAPIGLGITRTNSGDALAGTLDIAVEVDRTTTIGKRIEGIRIHVNVLETVTLEFEITHDRRQMDHDVG